MIPGDLFVCVFMNDARVLVALRGSSIGAAARPLAGKEKECITQRNGGKVHAQKMSSFGVEVNQILKIKAVVV